MLDKNEIRKHLIAHSASGLAGSAYCRRENLNMSTFRNWYNRREEYLASPAVEKLPFIRVSLPANDPTAGEMPPVLEVRLGNSATLRIPAEIDAARLGAILRTLKRSRVLG